MPLLALAMVVGCSESQAQQQDEVTTRAEAEMGCEAASVTLVSPHDCGYAGRYYTCTDDYRVVGCDQIEQWECVEANQDGCFELVHTTVTSPASAPLTLDGAPFHPTGDHSCERSEGAPGVTFHDAVGNGIQIIQNFDHSQEAIVHRVDGTTSPPMQDCVRATFSTTGPGVTGEATFDCAAAGLAVRGTLSFVDCA